MGGGFATGGTWAGVRCACGTAWNVVSIGAAPVIPEPSHCCHLADTLASACV